MQIAKSFDKESIKKAFFGAFIAGLVPAMIGILSYIQSATAGNPELNAFLIVAVPSSIYLIKKAAERTITIQKVLTSIGLGMVGSIIILLGQQNLGQYAVLLAWIAPSILNAIREWFKGQLIE